MRIRSFLLPCFLFLGLSACNGQSEGQPCLVDTDCQSGLSCLPARGLNDGLRCCPPAGQSTSNAQCMSTQSVGGPDASSAVPDTGTGVDAEAGSAADTGTPGDAADATPAADAADSTAPADAADSTAPADAADGAPAADGSGE